MNPLPYRPFNFLKKNCTHLLIGISFLIISISLFASTKADSKGKVNIIDIKDGADPEITPASHKPLEVIVYRLLLKEGDSILGKPAKQIYSVRYFKNENDTLIGYKSWLISDDPFDMAAYNWLSDSSFTLNLYNQSSGKNWETTLFGTHGASGIITEDKP